METFAFHYVCAKISVDMVYGKIPEDENLDSQDDCSDPQDYSEYMDASYDDQSGYSEDSSQSSHFRDRDDPNKATYSHRHYFEEQFGGKDKQKNATQKNLTKAENTASNTSTKNKTVANQENASSNATNQFNYKRPEKSGGDGGKVKKKGFLARHGKGLIGGGLGLALMGGILGIGFLVAGPLQFLQLGALFDDTIDFIADSTFAMHRTARLANNLARGGLGAQYNFGNNVKMGIIGDGLANRQIHRFANQGVQFTGDGTGLIFRQGDTAVDRIFRGLDVPSIPNAGAGSSLQRQLEFTQQNRPNETITEVWVESSGARLTEFGFTMTGYDAPANMLIQY